MPLINIGDAWLNSDMVKAIFPASRGSRIVMSDGSEVMTPDVYPREIASAINAAAKTANRSFDPDDLPF